MSQPAEQTNRSGGPNRPPPSGFCVNGKMSGAICSGSWAKAPRGYTGALGASRPESQSCTKARA
eukprot:709466-Pyramimonas_sp.AAC.1